MNDLDEIIPKGKNANICNKSIAIKSTIGSVYVLELEDNCFYIGYTSNTQDRINNHFKGKGSSWTKLHKPIKKLLQLDNVESIIEKYVTLEYMKTYGIDKVRGFAWCQIFIDTRHDSNLYQHIKNNNTNYSNLL